MSEPRASSVTFTETHVFAHLEDGRVIVVPFFWYPKLLSATAEQRSAWRLIADGVGICWEEIDEDISVNGMLCALATPAPVPKSMRAGVTVR